LSSAAPDLNLQPEPRRRSVVCLSPKGLHRVSYLEWGDPRNRDALVCVHGLTRSGRDFDDLARALCGRWRVVCPDIAGRGESDRLADPMLYAIPQYVSDMVTLIARLDVEAVSWVGTSMGGLIGMALAAQAATPVKKLVLNDAGPVIARASLERIATYVGSAPVFPSLEKAEEYVRAVSAPFGPHSDAQWRFLAETWVRRNDDGSYAARYDPRIGEAFRSTIPKEGNLEFWPVYDAVHCPSLVIRGERSDLLSRETASEMGRRGPKARMVEVAGVGHAPTLMHASQIDVVRNFLLEGEDA
jgi:pimeloyl-ACP methyl ester carboxylesterase